MKFIHILEVVLLVSVITAIYGLILYLHNFKTEIQHYKPFWKFFSIKLALFLSLWQKKILIWTNIDDLIDLKHAIHTKDITSADYIDHCLICIEMFILAVVATYTFSYEDFSVGISKNSTKVFLKIPRIFYEQFKQTLKDIGGS